MKYRVYLACQRWNPERIPLPRTHCGIQTWPPWTTPQKHVHSHPITVKAGRFQSLYTVYTNFLNDSLRSNTVYLTYQAFVYVSALLVFGSRFASWFLYLNCLTFCLSLFTSLLNISDLSTSFNKLSICNRIRLRLRHTAVWSEVTAPGH